MRATDRLLALVPIRRLPCNQFNGGCDSFPWPTVLTDSARTPKRPRKTARWVTAHYWLFFVDPAEPLPAPWLRPEPVLLCVPPLLVLFDEPFVVAPMPVPCVILPAAPAWPQAAPPGIPAHPPLQP